VTRDRLYIDALQKVMSNTSKVMIDVDGSGGNMMVLPLDQIIRSNRGRTPEVSGSFEGTSNSQLRDFSAGSRSTPVRSNRQ